MKQFGNSKVYFQDLEGSKLSLIEIVELADSDSEWKIIEIAILFISICITWIFKKSPQINSMKNIEKKKTEPFKEFIYNRIAKTGSYPALYISLVALNVIIDLFFLFVHIDPHAYRQLNITHAAILYTSLALICLFALATLASLWKEAVRGIWIYFLLLLQSSGGLFLLNLESCIKEDEWCQEDEKMYFISIASLILYTCMTLIFSLLAYYPFNSTSNLFAINQQYMPVYIFFYKLLISLIEALAFFKTDKMEIKIEIMLVFLVFLKSRNSGYINPLAKKMWEIYFVVIAWSYLVYLLSQHSDQLGGIGLGNNERIWLEQFVTSFWTVWGYSVPFIGVLPLFYAKGIGSEDWFKLFLAEKHRIQKIESRDRIYQICNQYYQKLQQIHKCEMRYKDEQFKKLWDLIQTHNSACFEVDCPLKELDQIKNISDDDFLQQKRFSKAIQASLEFGSVILNKMKETYPNDFELNIEIGCYELFALRNKQKGMKIIQELDNYDKEIEQEQDNEQNEQAVSNVEQNNKSKHAKSKDSKFKELSFSHRYAIFYLKKLIEDIFVGQERLAQTNMENEISEFRQKVEISVTMLAEFWSLLADPKCNLKKLYDLTNVLFPLKMSVEDDWERIKQYRNIESYNFYAKYLIKMFNDKEKGSKILNEAKKIEFEQRNKEEIELNNKTVDLVEENGVIFLEFDGKNSGVIFQVNVNAEKIFGYCRGELMQRKVNDIMPGIYATHHDKILEHYQETNQSTMMNKERHVWGKSKDGHIFQFTILIKPILNFYSQASTSEVYGSIKREIYIKEVAGIVVDTEGEIREISSPALSIFPILNNYQSTTRKTLKALDLEKKHSSSELMIPITEIIPDFEELKEKIIKENQHYEIEVSRTFSEDHSGQGQNVFEQSCIFNLQISEVYIKIAGIIGYILKFTKSSQSTWKKRKNSKAIVGETKKRTSINMDLRKRNSKSIFSSEGQSALATSAQDPKHKHKEPKHANKNAKDSDSDIDNDDADQEGLGEIGVDRKFMFSFNIADNPPNFKGNKEEVGKKKEEQDCNNSGGRLKEKEERVEERRGKERVFEQMKYIGGYFKFKESLCSFLQSSVGTFKSQLKRSQIENELDRVDFGVGIKTKRLLENQIREMREEEDSLNFNNQGENNENHGEEEEQTTLSIKPTELSQILEKETNNKLITYLKAITILILLISCAGCITEYLIMANSQSNILNQLTKIKEVNEISCEALYMREQIVFLSKYPDNQYFSLSAFQQNINELDSYLDYFSFSGSTRLVYSDGSTDDFYLGFALSKLISEGNSIRKDISTNLVPSASQSSNAFFITYNMVNGIQVSLEEERSSYESDLSLQREDLQKSYLIFLIVIGSVILVMLVVKNFIIRCALNKKSEILEVFFEIPRRSCSLIQKECEKFITRLSLEGEDEEMDLSDIEDEPEENSSSRANAQKKRQIIGEEKNTLAFILGTFLFLLILLFFHLFIFTSNLMEKEKVTTSFNAAEKIFELETSFSLLSNFMTSAIDEPSMPINNSLNLNGVIQSKEEQIQVILEEIKKSYHEILSILGARDAETIEQLVYRDICSFSGSSHCISDLNLPQESYGLNSIISQYNLILKEEYQKIITGSTTASDIISEPRLTEKKLFQFALKKHWRRMTQKINSSLKEYFKEKLKLSLWLLIVVCILNLSLWLGLWWKYYKGVEEKIVATEYILTFIPLNEINKNPKIAAYIKEKILKK